MSMEAAAVSDDLSPFEQLRFARQVVLTESRALERIANRLDQEFCRAVQLVFACRGSIIVCGMGKAGLVGQKIMATLASTGTPSHGLHPAEAIHGDLGRLGANDVVLMLSQSGETEEIVRLIPSIVALGVPMIAITSKATSSLGRAATVTIELGDLEEACALGLAPSTSTTAMLAVGDALALVVSRMRHFGREDFARFHPGGSLGYKLSRVEQQMRPIAECRIASETETVRQVLIGASKPGRRTGATMLIDAERHLVGIFTDSDLARLFEHRRDGDLDRPIRQVMTCKPLRVAVGTMMVEAVAIMAERKISELPVVDDAGHPVGLLDITDIVSLLPKDSAKAEVTPVAVRTTTLRVVREHDEGHGA
jgi:arabinose-5-phosphate isomerase